MLYKLLIVDDEEDIREGIASIVDWESIGYEVVATLEDGKDALEYIDKNSVDVVLSDIKMTFVSGLQLANNIMTTYPRIKVVLLSGFREFEFVKEALNYNVVDYLLKPTDLDELIKIFSRLKQRLDEEREKEKKRINDSLQYQERMNQLQEQFFTDLVMGVIRNQSDVKKRIEMLGLNKYYDRMLCAITDVEFRGYEGFLKKDWQYGKESFNNVIRNVFKNDDGLQVYLICYESGRIKLLIIDDKRLSVDEMKISINNYFQKISQTLTSLFKLVVQVVNMDCFNNLFEIINYNKSIFLQQAASFVEIDELAEGSNMKRLIEQKKLFVSYANQGNVTAVHNLLDSFFDELKYIGLPVMQNFLIDLFVMLVNHMNNYAKDMPGYTPKQLSYSSILNISEISQLKDWCHNQLETIMQEMVSNSEVSERNVIKNAKTFINNNIGNDICLEDVAEYVYLNANYFSRLFKKETGESFSDYVIRIKIDKAKELLRDPKYKVYEVCSMLGYKNIKYFYKLFKKEVDMTPSEYRDTL